VLNQVNMPFERLFCLRMTVTLAQELVIPGK
jgi:hypothetical protein